MEHVPRDDVETTEAVPGVHLSQLAGGERTSVQGFAIDPGASVPTHSHPHEQAGYVASGTLTFLVEPAEASDADADAERVVVNGAPADDDEVIVAAGESYVIPADQPHGAINDGDVPVEGVDVFSPPRPDPDWASDG
jgi:quercetin dioxygenase-like cupin family protein